MLALESRNPMGCWTSNLFTMPRNIHANVFANPLTLLYISVFDCYWKRYTWVQFLFDCYLKRYTWMQFVFDCYWKRYTWMKFLFDCYSKRYTWMQFVFDRYSKRSGRNLYLTAIRKGIPGWTDELKETNCRGRTSCSWSSDILQQKKII